MAVQGGPEIACPTCGGAVRSQTDSAMGAFGVVWETCTSRCGWSGRFMRNPVFKPEVPSPDDLNYVGSSVKKSRKDI